MPPPSEPPENKLVDMLVALAATMIALSIFGALFAALFDRYIGFISWFYSSDWKFWKILIKIAVIAADIAMFFFIVFVSKRFANLNRALPQKEKEVPLTSKAEEINTVVGYIRDLARSPNPSDWHMALLRADAALEDLLRHLGYEGATLADRLAIMDPNVMPSLDNVWSAHRLRNTIAHDPLQQHPQELILNALSAYEAAFRELGYIHAPSDASGSGPPDEIIRNV